MKRKKSTSTEEKEGDKSVVRSRKENTDDTFAYWSSLRLRQASPLPMEEDAQRSRTHRNKEGEE